MIYAQALLVWLAFGLTAVTLGALREKLLDHLLADLNLFRGRLWPLVLLTELAGPWVALQVLR